MDLQTRVPVYPGHPRITYKDELLVLGSCFAENMGKKLEYYQFRSLQNPFGILYQPEAIYRVMKRAAEQRPYTEDDIFFHNERWHSFSAHSALSDPNKKKVLQSLNQGREKLQQAMKDSSHLLLSLGTAWVYRSNRTSELVANCHKVPAKEFRKELLDADRVIHYLDEIRNLLPVRTSLLITVSPVRHLRDGFTENQLSKAQLITAAQQVKGWNYFPSYELMMDELRDYRFYASDMVHPSSLAVDYIWEKFRAAWIDPFAETVMQRVGAVRSALAHRPFDPDSQAHREFRSKLDKKIASLQDEYPFMTF